MNSRSLGSTWGRRGAAGSSPSEIPVRRRIIGGSPSPGLTRVGYRSITSAPRNLTAPISMTWSTAELRPVASRSRQTTRGKSPASSRSCSAQWDSTLPRGRGPLRQRRALTLGEGDVGCQRALLEFLDGEAEPVAAEVEVGMVDLVGISREDELGRLRLAAAA